MAQFADSDSGRKRRMDPFEESDEYGLRTNDSVNEPEFEIFKWRKSSCLTPVPVKTLQQVLEDPRELAAIQVRMATLSSEDEGLYGSCIRWMIFQRLGREVLLSKNVETPSRVRAGVKQQGAVCVPEELSEMG